MQIKSPLADKYIFLMCRYFFYTACCCIVSITPFKANAQSWNLSGNTGTNTTDHFVGTIDNNGVAFRTSNLLRMIIDANGYVGIGVSAPQYQFDLLGDARISGVHYVGGKVAIGTTSFFGSEKLRVNGDARIDGVLSFTGSTSDPVGENGKVYFNSTSNAFRGYINGAWKSFLMGSSADGSSDFVQNQSSASQTGSFWLSGASRLDDQFTIKHKVWDGGWYDGLMIREGSDMQSGVSAISWWNDNKSFYKARIGTDVGYQYGKPRLYIQTADNLHKVATRMYFENGDVYIPTNKLGIGYGLNNTLTGTAALQVNGAGDFQGWMHIGALASDPTSITNGTFYYNSSSNTFKGYQNGAWRNLLTGTSADGSADFIKNQTASAQTGGFNISGIGTMGGANITYGNSLVIGDLQAFPHSRITINSNAYQATTPLINIESIALRGSVMNIDLTQGQSSQAPVFNLSGTNTYVSPIVFNANLVNQHTNHTPQGFLLSLTKTVEADSYQSGMTGFSSTIQYTNGTVAGKTNTLYAFYASASLGNTPTGTGVTNRYSFYGANGTLYNKEPVIFDNTLKMGNLSADPTGSSGMTYYNNMSNTFKGYLNGAWKTFLMKEDVSSELNNVWNLNGNSGTAAMNSFIGTNDPQALIFKTGGAEAMRVTELGQVAIGTTDTKGYKLAVNGDAIFTKVKVKQYGNWADYVFAPNYKLPSLKEVEDFIHLHRHLPGVPSTGVVEKEGLDLGSNQTVLLKKIEELTLYIIEQDKKIKEQEMTIDELNQFKEEVNKKLDALIKAENCKAKQ